MSLELTVAVEGFLSLEDSKENVRRLYLLLPQHAAWYLSRHFG